MLYLAQRRPFKTLLNDKILCKAIEAHAKHCVRFLLTKYECLVALKKKEPLELAILMLREENPDETECDLSIIHEVVQATKGLKQ